MIDLGDDSTQLKLDSMVDDLWMVVPLFFRTIFHGQEGSTHNPMSSEFKVMGLLTRRGSMPTSSIGAWLRISKPNMTAIIDKLIEDGLVERSRDPSDRRVVNVSLTAKGSDHMKVCFNEARETVKAKLTHLTSEETEALYSSLENLRVTLSKINGVDPEAKPPFYKMLERGHDPTPASPKARGI